MNNPSAHITFRGPFMVGHSPSGVLGVITIPGKGKTIATEVNLGKSLRRNSYLQTQQRKSHSSRSQLERSERRGMWQRIWWLVGMVGVERRYGWKWGRGEGDGEWGYPSRQNLKSKLYRTSVTDKRGSVTISERGISGLSSGVVIRKRT